MLKQLMLASALSLAATSVLAAEQDFELVNQTGYTISEVYVSPTGEKRWGEDILGKNTLSNRQSMDLTFDRSADACKWDLKVVYELDDETAEWQGFNLCKVSTITIFYDAESGETTAEYE
ncbi:MAG: argininosuccinate lyase [Caulobacteraceae bacterium]|nr:argininosuccinate lyase [Caulobacteraceae bacterium]